MKKSIIFTAVLFLGFFLVYPISTIQMFGVSSKKYTPEQLESIIYSCENDGGFKYVQITTYITLDIVKVTCENGVEKTITFTKD